MWNTEARFSWNEVKADNSLQGVRASHTADIIDNVVYFFGGWNGKRALNDLDAFDTQELKWLTCKKVQGNSLPSPRNNHASAVDGTRLYIHGGHTGQEWIGDMYYIDVQFLCRNSADTAILVSSEDKGSSYDECSEPHWVCVEGEMPASRACHSLNRVGRRLFLFGGYDGEKCFHRMEIFDLDNQSWSVPSIKGVPPSERNAHSMVTQGFSLILFGGHVGNKHLSDVYIFNTRKMIWTTPRLIGFPPRGLRGHTATLVDTQLFCFGGYNGETRSNQIFVLDLSDLTSKERISMPKSDDDMLISTGSLTSSSIELKWVHVGGIPSSPCPRQRHTATLIDKNRVLVFGGFDGATWLKDLYILTIETTMHRTLVAESVMNHSNHMRKLLYMNPAESFADIVLVVNGNEMNAHRNILSASSDYFKSMFKGRMKEAKLERVELVETCSHQAFRLLLEYLYCGCFDFCIDPDILLDTLGLSDKYSLPFLSDLTQSMLSQLLKQDNIFKFLMAAHKFSAYQLKRNCVSFFLENSRKLVITPGFSSLQNEPALMFEITRLCFMHDPSAVHVDSGSSSPQLEE